MTPRVNILLKMWIGSKNKNHEILILQVHFLIVKAEDKKKNLPPNYDEGFENSG